MLHKGTESVICDDNYSGALPQPPPETLSLDSARKLSFLDLQTRKLNSPTGEFNLRIRGLGTASPAGLRGSAPYGSLRVTPSE